MDQQHPQLSHMLHPHEFLMRLLLMQKTHYKSFSYKKNTFNYDCVPSEENPFLLFSYIREAENKCLGKAICNLMGLNYFFQLHEIIPILNTQGECKGKLELQIIPCLLSSASTMKKVGTCITMAPWCVVMDWNELHIVSVRST